MKNELLVSLSNQSHNVLDERYFLLLVPAIFYLVLFMIKNLVSSSSIQTKMKISNVAGIVMIATSILFFIDAEYSKSQSMNMSFIFKNINNYLLLALGSGILLKKYSFVKAFIPTAIVLALAPIVSNPEDSLTASQAINNLILATAPLLVLIVTNKSLTFNGLAISLLTNLIFMAVVFASNSLEMNAVKLSASQLSSNTFYGFFKVQFIQVFIFILAALLLEALIWVLIRLSFASNKERNFVLTLRIEIRNEKRQLDLLRRDVMSMNIADFEVLLLENENDSSFVESLEKEVKFDEPKKYSFEKLLDTFTIIRTRNAQGTRAPSL